MKLIVGFLLFSLSAVYGAGLTPYQLECEARSNPLGIDTQHPRFSWKLRSDRQGDAQTAYQILVATSPDKLTEDQADLWKIHRPAPETTWIEYHGQPLSSFAAYWWTVRVSSALGGVSPWSKPAEWTMGIANSHDRKGRWIAPLSYRLTAGPMPLFRREFNVDHPLRRALVLVSGLGSFELHVNGAKIGSDVLAPAWTNYRAKALYETYDITSALQQGSNAIGVMLGNGFYNVVGGRYSKFTGSFGVPRLWLQLHLEFADGRFADIATDGSWRVAPGPITLSDVYGGEDFDARHEPSDWARAHFNDADWSRAASTEAPAADHLVSDTSPPMRERETLHAIRITEPKPGIFVYDLGRNFAGWPSIAVSGPAGASVKLTPGELLDDSGLVTQRSEGGGPTYFTYTLRGSATEHWEPRFSYYGFRYVQVEGAAPPSFHRANLPVLLNLEGKFIYLDVKQTGRFSSSNNTLNQIHALILEALKSNLQHVLTDCPHREKLGWLEVSYLMAPSMLYDYDLRNFFPKVIADIRESQTINGLIPDIAPEYVEFSSGFRDSPEWGSAGILLPWLQWQWYGNKQPLAATYNAMAAYQRYLHSKATDGLLLYGLGDWYDIAPGPPGPSKLTPPGVTSTATYIHDLQVLRQTAQLLGHSNDAATFAEEETTEKQAFEKAFYHPAVPSYASNSQTALAMPLDFGIAPDFARSALVNHLVDDIRRKGTHTTAGDIGYHYVLQALQNAGRSDVIFDMATEKTAPSYAGQINAGATALTEAWDANPNSSQNHLMLGHIEEWFYSGLAGIRPDENSPGLHHIFISPQIIGDLTDVNASWDTLRGPVSVHWERDSSTFRVAIDLPPGMSADLTLPAPRGSSVSLGPPTARSHVHLLHRTGKGTTFALASGHYDVTVQQSIRP